MERLAQNTELSKEDAQILVSQELEIQAPLKTAFSFQKLSRKIPTILL
jgi:hypothetical protein